MESEELYKKWKTIIPNLETESIDTTYKPEHTLEARATYFSKTALFEEVDAISLSRTEPYSASSEEILDQTVLAPAIPEKSSSEFFPNSYSGYEMLQEIARGGMGIVFRGRQRSLDREVAIKKLQRKLFDPEEKAKFIVESKVTAFLDHPNIVPVYELGETPEKEIILVMKLIGGKSWKEVLKEDQKNEKPLSRINLEKHLRILLSVCNAVAFAHNKKIIHNDLKPENIMLGEFGEIFLMDWGIAVSLDEQNKNFVYKSMITSPMGTPSYMAPELADGRGQDIGPWTDIYMLGAILFEILMQRPPHLGRTMFEVLYSICYIPVELSEEVPKELKQICMKSLEKQHQDRYPSVSEFRSEIENFLQHQESIFIAQEAHQILKECQEQKEEQTSKEGTSEVLYDQFAQSIAGFRQALKLWEQNADAAQGEINARYAYAHIALKKGDFGLAEAQLEKIRKTKEAETLEEEITQAKEVKSRKELAQKIIHICTFVLLMMTFKVTTSLITYFVLGEEEFVFLNNHPIQSGVNSVFFLITGVFYFNLTTKTYSSPALLRMALFYEICGAFLLSLSFLIIELPKNIQATGVYISALWILFFRFLVPYTGKMIWLSGFGSVLMVVVSVCLTSLAGNSLPEGDMVPVYFVQHLATAIIGGLICSIKAKP